jgi:hypothetical protein
MSLKRSHQFLLAAGLAALAAALVLAGCGGGGGVAKTTTGAISGAVRNAQTSAVIAGASVALPPTGKTATSSGSGAFTLARVRPGAYTVVAQADGYTCGSAAVTVTAGAVSGANIALQPASAPTPIGASGGTVADTGPSGEQAACLIPAGALDADTDIAVTALPASQAPPSPNEDTGHVAAAFAPYSQTFAASVTITVPTPRSMTPGSSVSLFMWDPTAGAWTAAGSATVDAGGRTASAGVTQFGIYAVIEQRAVTAWSSAGSAAVQIHEVVTQSFVMTQAATVNDMYGVALASPVSVVTGAIYWLRYTERPNYPDNPERERIDEILTLLEQAVAHNQGGGGGG